VDIPRQSQFGTLGWTFRHAGYQTAYFGKWHLGGTDARPFGWEKSIIWMNTNSHRVKNGFVVDGGKKAEWDGLSNSTATVRQALDWLRHDADRTRPFFLMVSVNPPHPNLLDARDDMTALYPDEASLPFHPHDTVRDWEQHRGYHAHISGVDADLGDVMQLLDNLKLTENTILVYTSDHGGMGGVRGIGYGSKRLPYDESARVPFLIQWPGKVTANKRSDALFSSIDIYPTLCSLAGVDTVLGKNSKSEAKQTLKYNSECPGVDFSKNLLGQPGGVDPDSVFLMHISNMNNANPPFAMHHRTIVTKKTMFSVMPQGEFCLFDNSTEYQTENLIRDPRLVAERKALRQKIGDWIRTAETPFIGNWMKKATGPKMQSWFGPQGNTIDGTDGVFRLEKITGIAPEDTPDTFTVPGLPKKKKGGKKKKKKKA
ncbi:MAG: sulfatase-like hydrolase/transferase, partial [Kiritimatiellales bacterium]|nr:sulfatase-like hydrolase/transferase [Kiritimatiellales bacterium]